MMIKLVLVLYCFNGLVSSAPKMHYNLTDAESYFEEFIQLYNKKYASDKERQERFEIFKKSLETVNEENKYSVDGPNFGITKFSDWTEEEFMRTYNNPVAPSGPERPYRPEEELQNINGNIVPYCNRFDYMYEGPFLTRYFDWRKRGKVSPVKNQHGCNSAWAHAIVADIESAYLLKYNKSVDVSEQQLIDCVTSAEDGCKGDGDKVKAMTYLKVVGGIMSERDYPYTGRGDGVCKFNKSAIAVQITNCAYGVPELVSFTDLNSGLMKYLLEKGPVAVGVNARNLQFYTGGILPSCGAGGVYHHGLLVGYHHHALKNSYWLIKNSWGSDWGEEGYIKVPMDDENCGIHTTYYAHLVTKMFV